MKTIKVGTRGSALALTQTKQTIEALSKACSDYAFELVVIKTKGDLNQTTALDKFGDKGIFVTEIEDQLLSGDIDIAVHSMKDMPSVVTEGLAYANPPQRQDPRDVLITQTPIKNIMDLPVGAVIGTGSKRRAYQLKHRRPDLHFIPIRGNVDTRLKKLETENLDGVILAAAGLKRLGLDATIPNLYEIPVEVMLPAPAQGTLALQYRADDMAIQTLLEKIADEVTGICATAERSFMKYIEGGCHAPMGAIATLDDHQNVTLKAVFGDPEGQKLYFSTKMGPLSEAEALGKACAMAILSEMKQNGFVTLLGAGPGDMGLMTLKGFEAIKTCDAIVYDRLANPTLLSYVPKHAEKYYVGKTSGNHFYTQDETNQLLVTLAKQGKTVVRLKGGDPYVFGRGGEEGEVLRSEGIAFEVVPGISSSIAGLNYAGIPITHRDFTSSFHVFTAHFKNEESSLDFKTISALSGTLVFLMGIANMHLIAKKLMENGKNPQTPVAMISKATTYKQKTFISTLEKTATDLPNDMALSPALFVVGEVVTLRDTLNWFETKPLFGTSTLVTRSLMQASKLEAQINQKGGRTLSLPLLEIKPRRIEAELSSVLLDSSINHIWFTSENAVHTFMETLFALGNDIRNLSQYQFLAIGNGTANVLKTYGIIADFIPENFTQDGIIAYMSSRLKDSDHVLLPLGNLANPKLGDWVNGICQCTTLITYDTMTLEHDVEVIEQIKTELKEQPFILPFTSSSTASHFHDFCEKHSIVLHEDSKIYAIGPTTESTLLELGYTVNATSEQHNIDGLVTLITKEHAHETL